MNYELAGARNGKAGTKRVMLTHYSCVFSSIGCRCGYKEIKFN
jgi:hypothetical protein